MIVSFDSSTLILLAKADLLRLVAEDFGVLIPRAVKEECLAIDSFDSRMISTLIGETKIDVLKVARRATVDRLKSDFRLHRGEAEALALAIEKKTSLAADDLLAIKACRILDVRFVTAIHFLIALNEKGKITEQMSIAKLDKLSYYGRYNKKILDDARERLKGGN
jgi:predicted nucleic acid-binding protein